MPKIGEDVIAVKLVLALSLSSTTLGSGIQKAQWFGNIGHKEEKEKMK